jgi:hypothetical protein
VQPINFILPPFPSEEMKQELKCAGGYSPWHNR